jgi:hypothetical protein
MIKHRTCGVQHVWELANSKYSQNSVKKRKSMSRVDIQTTNYGKVHNIGYGFW